MKETKWEEIEDKCKELCKLIENYEESAEAAKWVIIEVVAWAQHGYYEAIGIIEDARDLASRWTDMY